ncbi:hypothetical protein KSS87_006343 [Heliosperma pusillum]|nr:hypothetical protein KSS87_006343 [Heliosperma pusillum]
MSNNSSSKHSSTNLETLRELTSTLRDKNDILEDELGKLKSEQVSWDVERSRLYRELEVKDEKLNDLATKLGFSNEAEAKAIKRYDRALEYCREVEAKMEDLKRGIEVEREEFMGKLSVLKDELVEREVELRELRKRNTVCEVELGDLRVRNKELGKIEVGFRQKDEEIGELRKRNEGLLERIRVLENEISEIGELRRRNVELESEKEELFGKFGVLKDEIMEIKKKKNGKIEELTKAKEGLEKEKMIMEERLLKLESNVAIHCISEAKRGVMFGKSEIEKILSLISSTLDGEQKDGATVKQVIQTVGNLNAEPALVSHVNVLKCEETVETTVLSSEELVGENGAAWDGKSHSPTYIQISDSDDDEISLHVSGVKRARASSVCEIQKDGDNNSSDGSQNPKLKIKKLESVLRETSKCGQPIAKSDCRSDSKSSTLHNQKVATIRKCKGNNNILEYMKKRQEHLKKNEVAGVADMVLACQKDPEFCTKAICALFRNGLLSSGQKGFEKRDMDRGIALAKYLVDGDPNSDKKKSVDELKQRYPDGLDTCKKLVLVFSDKLFDIFKSNKDNLFSQKSTEVQYR